MNKPFVLDVAGKLRLALSTDLGSMCAISEGLIIQVIAALDASPVAIMDTRDALGLCAATEADFPALYALQGRRVMLVALPDEAADEDLEAP